MNEKELAGKVHSAVYRQCRERGFAAPVDVLMDIGVLEKDKYEDWRFGKVPYLEKVCSINLRKLSSVMHQIRSYADKNGLKPSFTVYKQWGSKGKNHAVPLRFSKTGSPRIERAYATHFFDEKRTDKLKQERSEYEKRNSLLKKENKDD